MSSPASSCYPAASNPRDDGGDHVVQYLFAELCQRGRLLGSKQRSCRGGRLEKYGSRSRKECRSRNQDPRRGRLAAEWRYIGTVGRQGMSPLLRASSRLYSVFVASFTPRLIHTRVLKRQNGRQVAANVPVTGELSHFPNRVQWRGFVASHLNNIAGVAVVDASVRLSDFLVIDEALSS